MIKKFGHKQDIFLTETASFFSPETLIKPPIWRSHTERQEAVHLESEIHTVPTVQGSGSKPEIYSASQEPVTQ